MAVPKHRNQQRPLSFRHDPHIAKITCPNLIEPQETVPQFGQVSDDSEIVLPFRDEIFSVWLAKTLVFSAEQYLFVHIVCASPVSVPRSFAPSPRKNLLLDISPCFDSLLLTRFGPRDMYQGCEVMPSNARKEYISSRRRPARSCSQQARFWLAGRMAAKRAL